MLTVKFYIPKPRHFLTDRPDLLDRLTIGVERCVTLLSAPAGFGKSTLLSTWMAGQMRGSVTQAKADIFCWLSLDPLDNQAARFWSYFVAAIQSGIQKRPLERGSTTDLQLSPLLEILQSAPPSSIPALLDELINTISESSTRVLLVLDDYHVIQASEIHEQMAYLLDHQPPNLHLILSTRADPPLPIARLRARGQLSEFRVADLRFTTSETEKFFKNATDFTVTGEDITAIQINTEGWIAGLQMAALALQAVLSEASALDDKTKQDRIKEFVFSFSGKHLYVLDYLTDEVFNHQSETVKMFLLKTSILERMNAGLCAAVLRDEADKHEVSPGGECAAFAQTKAILDYLEKSNLFLVGLDQERQWFRYHHLFADLLRARLGQTWPALLPELHRRASRWYEQNDLAEEAIAHALSATDWDEAARLMEIYVTAYLERGQLAVVLRWIETLPNPVLQTRPVLCAQVAWALAHAGQFQRVPPLLDALETSLAAWEKPPTENNAVFPSQQDWLRVRGTVAGLRAFGKILAGKPQQALQLGKNALEANPGFEPRELAWLNWLCGYAYRSMGELDEAIRFHEIALEISRKADTIWEEMATELGIAYRFRGKLTQAVAVFRNALSQAEQQGARNQGNLSRVEACLSAALCDQNHLEEALQHAQKGIFYLQWWPSHNHITTAYIYLGQVLLGLGRLDEAAEAIQRAEQEQHKGQVLPTVLQLVEKISIQLWIRRGDWRSLEHWLATQATTLPDFYPETGLFDEYEGLHRITLARAWIASGKKEAAPQRLEQAFHLLSQLEILAKRSHWVHALIEIHLLQAMALHEMGENGKAQDFLTHSLELGLPAGYVRIYLQEGEVVAEMLQTWLKSPTSRSGSTSLKPSRVKNLLDQFAPDQSSEGARTSKDWIEPLTGREREVLQLLALGLSNQEIAERMVVSQGTVKTHVHNLIGKLGAQSRTHVLARAKELDLL
jgi:LuxR family maltose regulon positive regulatory protein